MTDTVMELVIVAPDGGTQRVALEPGRTCLIGRGSLATIRVNDPHVSRTHCQIESIGEHWLIEDLGSSSGTLVAGKRITKQPLLPGDAITLGRTTMTFQQAAPERAVAAPEPKPSVAIPRSLKDLVGRQVHDYLIEQVLVESPQDAVFLARDVERGREAAVKVFWPDPQADDSQRRRFVRSILSMKGLQHPGLVRLYSAGHHGPYVWLAMEYVPGENLRQVIDRIGTVGMLDWRVAFRVALDIGRALAVLEEAGVVHRNITPRSILRTPTGQSKLAGVSVAKTPGGDPLDQITRKGELVGEVAYLSPEIILAGQLDHRADLYGLGATVYGLLTGRPPYPFNNIPELLAMLSNRAYTPPLPKTFQLSINDLFEGAVMRLLARDPADRYQSAVALVRDLERIGKYTGVPVA
jgi:serine/threonine protein kinase